MLHKLVLEHSVAGTAFPIPPDDRYSVNECTLYRSKLTQDVNRQHRLEVHWLFYSVSLSVRLQLPHGKPTDTRTADVEQSMNKRSESSLVGPLIMTSPGYLALGER